MLEPPHTEDEAEEPSASERAAYRWLLELLLDAFARGDRRDTERAVVCTTDGAVFVWQHISRDHCPRCQFIRWVYLCDRTRALACLCRLCRTLEVVDGLGRKIALAANCEVATEDLPPELPASGNSVDEILAARAKTRVLPFVALWPLRPDRRTRNAKTKPVSPGTHKTDDQD